MSTVIFAGAGSAEPGARSRSQRDIRIKRDICILDFSSVLKVAKKGVKTDGHLKVK